MVDRLRSAATEDDLAHVIEEQTVPEAPNDGGRRNMAVAMEKEIAGAEKVEFLLFDRYGDDVHRVNLRLTTGDKVRTVSMLLVPGKDDALRWAGPS